MYVERYWSERGRKEEGLWRVGKGGKGRNGARDKTYG